MLEARVRHWLTLATGPVRRLPVYPYGRSEATPAARLAVRQGWIRARLGRSPVDRARGLGCWALTDAGAAAAEPGAAAPPPASAGGTHAAIVAAAIEGAEE